MSELAPLQTGPFMEQFTLPPTGDGPLVGLRFAIKDLIDVAGHRTGCGNPDWLATHPPARVSAVCVEQLLAAGAACTGKTISDEVAFSLLGATALAWHPNWSVPFLCVSVAGFLWIGWGLGRIRLAGIGPRRAPLGDPPER